MAHKTKDLYIRFSEIQLLELRRKAGKTNLSVFCRRILLNVTAGGLSVAGELEGVSKELVRVGNNLNQLSKHANATRELPEIDDIKAEIYKLIEESGNALSVFR